jgi:hypothetical protein
VRWGLPPSKRNLLENASAAQSLDGDRLTGSLLNPQDKNICDRPIRTQEEAELAISSDRSQLSVGHTPVR